MSAVYSTVISASSGSRCENACHAVARHRSGIPFPDPLDSFNGWRVEFENHVSHQVVDGRPYPLLDCHILGEVSDQSYRTM